MKTQTLLTLLALAGLVALAIPSAAAQQPLPAACPTTVGDPDGDGLPEVGSACSTPPCGCNCPVVGGGAHIQAAGQEATVIAATSICEYATLVSVDPGAPDPNGPVVVDPIIITRVP
ncbi:MAG: hypothetical protein QOI63_127 [Thermoplasmata archaeon]|jgi:hypothetical protein|nr:hypothetical protein [Thermoplasmata archaeon]